MQTSTLQDIRIAFRLFSRTLLSIALSVGATAVVAVSAEHARGRSR